MILWNSLVSLRTSRLLCSSLFNTTLLDVLDSLVILLTNGLVGGPTIITIHVVLGSWEYSSPNISLVLQGQSIHLFLSLNHVWSPLSHFRSQIFLYLPLSYSFPLLLCSPSLFFFLFIIIIR